MYPPPAPPPSPQRVLPTCPPPPLALLSVSHRGPLHAFSTGNCVWCVRFPFFPARARVCVRALCEFHALTCVFVRACVVVRACVRAVEQAFIRAGASLRFVFSQAPQLLRAVVTATLQRGASSRLLRAAVEVRCLTMAWRPASTARLPSP
jgi:hypothetical protein